MAEIVHEVEVLVIGLNVKVYLLTMRRYETADIEKCAVIILGIGVYVNLFL